VDFLIQVGLIELAVAALLGWAMVVRTEKPEWLKRIGVVQPHRILQIHLDYVLMGLILIAVGVVLPDIPDAAAWLLVFGTVVNPLLFVPLAFSKDADRKLWYRSLSVVSFLAMSVSLVWAAILGPGF
jgi:cell division protein FtsW (lipid II flippase)